MKVLRAGVHGFDEVLGIDASEIAFFWALQSSLINDQQIAYQVVLDTAPRSSAIDIPLEPFWTSGRVVSAAQRDVKCHPQEGFAATTRYVWRVWVWNSQDGVASSKWLPFFTAYPRSDSLPPYSMNQKYMPHSSLIFRSWFANEHDRWKAVWIGNGSDKPLYLRHSFSLRSNVQQVIAFASGLGHFALSCNGAPASSHLLDPGWTNPHKTVQFVAYDLTDRVKTGVNVVGAHVGNGFYAGDQGDRFFWPMYEDNTYVRYGNELCFFAEIHVFYDDGQHDVVISDPSWKVRASATTLANIYASETHDRRLYPKGWDDIDFDDSLWSAAKPLTGPRGKLKYQSQPPVVVTEIFNPVAVKQLGPGTLSFDLGQNSSIVPRLYVSGAQGTVVKIRYSETVDSDGHVLMPDPLFKQFETHVYSLFTLAGTGDEEVWQPDFCFTSARYIQIEGVRLGNDNDGTSAGLPVVHSVQGQHVSSASRQLGSLSTDVADVNALIKACYYSFTSNLFSYHTDCPQIEKFAWQEVTHLLFPATQYMRDIEALHTKIIDDIVDAQESDGLCPTMAPEMRYMCGPLHNTITWGCSVCFLPTLIKKYYGSTSCFAKAYPAAKAYMNYMRRWEVEGGLIEHGLGDWGRGIAFGNLQANIETAVYIECLRACALMAGTLGLAEESQHWQREVDRIKRVYNQLLLVTDDSSRSYAYYTSRDNLRQRDCDAISQAVALQFELVPDEYIKDVEQAFLEDAQDCHIRAGEIGLRYLWNTLRDLKRPDIVLAMARQEEHPSYMRFLRRGETTLLEFWQDECRSKCHDMLGTIYEWFYDAVLGLRIIDDAYKVFEINPCYEGEFGLVEGTVDCPYGPIKIKFEKTKSANSPSTISLSATIPFGTTARIVLPERVEDAVCIRTGSQQYAVTSSPLLLQHGKYTLSFRG